MKNFMIWAVLGLVGLSMTIYSFTPSEQIIKPQEIQWYTMEEAIAAQKVAPKKMMIDVYTDWCKWCKVMDQKTFSDPKVIDYLNENFYAVKFNAEQREAIEFQGKTYEYVQAGRRGIHQLAYELMGNKASFPSFVVLGEQLEGQEIIKGFKAPEDFLVALQKHEAL